MIAHIAINHTTCNFSTHEITHTTIAIEDNDKDKDIGALPKLGTSQGSAITQNTGAYSRGGDGGATEIGVR